MCGFTLTNLDKKINDYKQVLHHRGPDDTGLYSDDNIKILLNRLSIFN